MLVENTLFEDEDYKTIVLMLKCAKFSQNAKLSSDFDILLSHALPCTTKGI